jgi:hypothetical protein
MMYFMKLPFNSIMLILLRYPVAECKAASDKGLNGIMIRDTAETFGIISEDNRFRGMYPSLSVAAL